MGLLTKLKSVLGMGDGDERERTPGDVNVTVERDPADRSGIDDSASDVAPDAESERAVKEPAAEFDADESGIDEDDAAADATAGTDEPTADAADVIEEVGDDAAEPDLGRDAAETETGPDAGATPEPDAGAAPDPEPDATEVTGADAEDVVGDDAAGTEDATAAGGSSGPDVDDIKGIGPAYAQTLADVGVETVDDLADADPEEIADRTGLSTKRISRWIERAKAR